MTCTWESLRPGITTRPRRSMTRVVSLRCSMTSASEPTDRKRPSFTATDDAEGRRRSSVVIRPLVRIKSAPVDGVDACGLMAHPPSATAALAPESCVMNDRRLTISVIPRPLRRLPTRAVSRVRCYVCAVGAAAGT